MKKILAILLALSLLLISCARQPAETPQPLPPAMEKEEVQPVTEGVVNETPERGEAMESTPQAKEFTIEADDKGLYPSAIEVNSGDIVRITFKVRKEGTYYGGLDFRSNAFNTGKVPPGASKTVEFTASQTFQFKSYWPASNKLKATGTVTVK